MALYASKPPTNMDKLRRILIILSLSLFCLYCTNQIKKENSTASKSSLFLSSFNEYIFDTILVETDHGYNLFNNENQIYNVSFESIATYDDVNESVGFTFVNMEQHINIDPILELSIILLDDSLIIDNKSQSTNELNSNLFYSLLFSCDKEDSSRIFRMCPIGDKKYYSSGKVAFIYLSLDKDSSNMQKLNKLKILINDLRESYFRRRDEISIFHFNKPFNALKYHEQQTVDDVVPIKIVIHICPQLPPNSIVVKQNNQLKQ